MFRSGMDCYDQRLGKGYSVLMPPKFKVPSQVFLDAKGYVERKAVPFFDFYRNCAFGFVRVGEKKGHFVHLVVDEDGDLSATCNCREADRDEVCGHGFALFLKANNWPQKRDPLYQSFEDYRLCRFFKATGRKLYDQRFQEDGNPSLTLPEDVFDGRMLRYWNLIPDDGKLAQRDRKALEMAHNKVRTDSEWAMLEKNFPPSRILFEESSLYPLCKLFYFLERADSLRIRVTREPEHQVALRIGQGGNELFRWTMGVETFLKGIREDWDYWMACADFDVRKQGVPLTYRIRFREDGSLEIEPRVRVGPDLHPALQEVQLSGRGNLCFHEGLGYFRVQTGLSPFEMTYAEPGVAVVGREEVAPFLKANLAALESMDRALMDEALFGEVVVEQFDEFHLNLERFHEKRFDFDLSARLGDQRFQLGQLNELFRERGRYRKIGGKLFDSLGYDGTYLKAFCEGDAKRGDLSVGDLFRLMAFFRERLDVDVSEWSQAIFERLKSFKVPDLPDLSHTELNLRDYQKLGYEWLYFLRAFGLGGLLCDQMGLGKTHQGMALLAAVAHENPAGKSLVVAPTSVLFHWKEKLGDFCPELKAVIHHGYSRDAERALEDHQIVISSYGIVRNDLAFFRERSFDLAIFDEIQFVKNKDTKAYKSLTQLSADCKIGLTGTPIENQIGELKNLMDLIFPGYLGGDLHFKRYFTDPILKLNHEPTKEKVKALVHPFTLRRSKSEVLTELPEKIEDLRSFTLGEYEWELYKKTKSEGKRAMQTDGGEPLGVMHVFQLIGKLKMICNHPALFFGNEDYAAYPSAKWEMFTELLHEALDSGEKLVVFSQYLGMIAMFRRYLEHHQVGHAVITGATADRAAEQQRFMKDPKCRVFLGSLRASGVGIDLTSASILIHYDRWWNSAREEQATDRVHRIGQNKTVQVYKFKALNTVEERIDRIIYEKRALLEDVVGFDSENISKTFTLEELLEILR